MTKIYERIDRVNDLMHYDESLSQIFDGLKLSNLLAIPNIRDLLEGFFTEFAALHDDHPQPKARADKEAVSSPDFLLSYRDDVACTLSRLAGMLDYISHEAQHMDMEEFEDFTSQINAQAAAAFFELANLGCAVARTPMRFTSSSSAHHG